ERTFGTGVIVDTMEVAGLWSAVPGLYDGIKTALSAHAQAVACHLSHLYPSGSSLYFTFLITGADDHDAESRYLQAWPQAARTCHPGHATEAARQALRDGERYLVAVGGDGTVHEVVNGMVENGGPLAADAVLGVVAVGSGCDFVRSFGLPGNPVQGAAHLAG